MWLFAGEQETESVSGEKLYEAIKKGDLINVEDIVRRKPSDVNRRYKGFTPMLYAAAKRGHLDIVKFLVTKGADPNGATNDGLNSVDIAFKHNHGEVFQYLVEHGGVLTVEPDDIREGRDRRIAERIERRERKIKEESERIRQQSINQRNQRSNNLYIHNQYIVSEREIIDQPTRPPVRPQQSTGPRRVTMRDNTCPVCLEEPNAGEELMEYPCGHRIHLFCFNQAPDMLKKCPSKCKNS